jgi:hypothetical protein
VAAEPVVAAAVVVVAIATKQFVISGRGLARAGLRLFCFGGSGEKFWAGIEVRRSVHFRRDGWVGGGHQNRVLQQAAEFLFAGMMMFAFGIAEDFESLVLDFEAFEVNDANELIAEIPDLALSEL